MPARIITAGVIAAVVPDADVIGFRFGVAYGDVLGHRGLSHSLTLALILSAGLGAWLAPPHPGARIRTTIFPFVATASHGLLDAMTDGGLGVAFLAPFGAGRYFLPWRPIPVSPIGVGAFLSTRGLTVLRAEALWIWLPAAVGTIAGAVRRRSRPEIRGGPP